MGVEVLGNKSFGGRTLKNTRKISCWSLLVDVAPIQQTISMFKHLSSLRAHRDSKRVLQYE